VNKSELRRLYLQKRLTLNEPEYLQLNTQLCDRFFETVDFSSVKIIHSYLPLKEKKEPDTWLIIERIRKEFPHIRLSLPKINAVGQMENIFLQSAHQLQKNWWGIEEPINGTSTLSEKIDLVIVPLLCFDHRGNRVGYGKGYYDRFLLSCKPDVKKIGLSFFNEAVIIDDLTTNDIPLTACVTPTKVIVF
jgi:5-formyltetrahydrofolate cyclo-ligase